jgi:hypothetical protein
VSVLAGSFDQPSGLEGASHIFVADKGDYYTIADGLPQHRQWRREEGLKPSRA